MGMAQCGCARGGRRSGLWFGSAGNALYTGLLLVMVLVVTGLVLSGSFPSLVMRASASVSVQHSHSYFVHGGRYQQYYSAVTVEVQLQRREWPPPQCDKTHVHKNSHTNKHPCNYPASDRCNITG